MLHDPWQNGPIPKISDIGFLQTHQTSPSRRLHRHFLILNQTSKGLTGKKQRPNYYRRKTAAHLFKSSNISGSRKLSSDHSSARLFCNGVPVNNNLLAVLYVFSSLRKMITFRLSLKADFHPVAFSKRTEF